MIKKYRNEIQRLVLDRLRRKVRAEEAAVVIGVIKILVHEQ